MLDLITFGRRPGHKARIAVAAAVAIVGVITVGSAAASHNRTSPTPTWSLSITHQADGVHIGGGFKPKGVNLPTYYRITEQEFDASGNALPLSTSGYTFATKPDGSQVLLTTDSKAGRAAPIKLVLPQRIPGANSVKGTVTINVPATRTHKRASVARPFNFDLGGYTAAGTTVPQRALNPYNGPWVGWDFSSLVTSDTSPTVRLPGLWLQSYQFGASLGVGHWVGMGHEAPTSPQPTNDPYYDNVATATGLTVYPIKLVFDKGNYPGYSAIPYIAVLFDFSSTDNCEFTIRGMQSFTLPPSWKTAGSAGFFVNLLTLDPNGNIVTSSENGQTDYGTRTNGSLDVCQLTPPLTRFH